jgi:hypothetical protein
VSDSTPPKNDKASEKIAPAKVPDSTVEETLEAGQTPAVEAPEQSRWRVAAKQVAGGSAAISVLAVFLALIVGAIMIAATDDAVTEAAGRRRGRRSQVPTARCSRARSSTSGLTDSPPGSSRSPTR